MSYYSVGADPEIGANVFKSLATLAKKETTKAIQKNAPELKAIADALADKNKRAALVEYIEISSNVNPPWRFKDPFVPSQEQTQTTKEEEHLGKRIRPKFVIKFRGVDKPLSSAPWGEPDPSRWKVNAAVSVVGFGILGFLAIKGIRAI